jgi:hypothetical protein
MRPIASCTCGVETAKLMRMKRWPSIGSKSMPGAVATPVSVKSCLQNSRLSSVSAPTSA